MLVKTIKNLPVHQIVCDSVCSSKNPANRGLNVSAEKQAADFFTRLFDTSDWPPRWYCGNWTAFHGWLYIVSDLSIWAAYFAIPVLLFRILKNRKDIVPFSKVFWLFIAFILLCGSTHLIDAVIFWWPAYRLSALIRLFTGIISIITVFALYKLLPSIFNLPTLEQLEAEIEERKKAEQEARDQQILKQAAEDLMAKKDEFMSIASHELKTPITSVKASLQFLQRITDKNDTLQNIAPFIDKAARQVNKLTEIVNDLLDVSRIQAGKIELYKTDFNLLDLINESVENCLMENNLYNIKVTGDAQIKLYADRNRIEQVISNLLHNAVKYSPENKNILLSFEKQENGRVKTSVTDFGIGIPDGETAVVFDRFYRAENSAQYFSGVGLGLYISAEIVKSHNGEIGADSIFGKGSTFWFTL